MQNIIREKNTMNVVYTFDDGYTDITMVSMLSFLEANKEVLDVTICIVDCGITENNLNRIKQLVTSYKRNIRIVKAVNIEKRIPIKLDTGYWSVVCYVRLFFAEMFPDIDRIMHIDCDTLVRGNLDNVYYTNLDNYAGALCYDCLPSVKYQAGFQRTDQYFSNGFMIFNLEYIRKHDIEDMFIDYIVKQKGVLPHLDQDVVSAVLKNKVFLLPAKYNVLSVTFALKSDSVSVFANDEPYYSKNEILEALDNPIIIHFVGYRFYNKPWIQPCYHPYNQEWINTYKKLIGCKESKLKFRKSGMGKRFALFIWNIAGNVSLIERIERQIEVNYFRKKSLKYYEKIGNQ